MERPVRLQVYFDASCPFCRAARAWAEARDAAGRLTFRDLDACPDVAEPANRRSALVVVSRDGRQRRGFAGVVEVLAALPRWRTAARAWGAPPLRWLGGSGYRMVARLRSRIG